MSHSRTNPLLRHHLREVLRRPPAALALIGVPGMVIPGIAAAGPTGEEVIRGSAEIVRPDANNTVINQFTDRAVINWQTFNVDADEYILFNQPDASSIVLNRVLGGDTSYILGHMEANGQVFLLNPQGVFFTHGASLDVQGFLASTLDMDPDAFMAGDFTLTRNASSPATASVVNDGRITASPGGYVVLAGDFTENTGVITANAGTVALVSGNALTLDIEGDGLVSFTVDEATLSEAAGVRNAGSLVADGGRVIMTAKVANDLVATAVNNEGLVRAHSVAERDGEIYLVGHGGNVENHGTLDANGDNAGGGGIAIYSDRDVLLADGAVQTAAGDGSHAGGVIRAIAERHLDYQEDNLVRVTGGPDSQGGGGFVEVSGHGSIALRGIPQIGAGGTYLVDPANINIVAGSGSGSVGTLGVNLLIMQLNQGVDVIVAASNSITATAGSLGATGSGDLTIGIGQMSFGTDVASGCPSYGNYCFGAGATFTQTGSGTINVSGMNISVGGNVLVAAGSGGSVTLGDIATGNGNISISADNIRFNRLSTGNGNIELLASTADFSTAGVNGGAGGITATGYVDINAGSYGGVVLNSDVNAGGDVNINGNQVRTLGLAGNNIYVEASANGMNATLTVNGNVSADNRADFINQGNDSTSNITINGDVQASAIDISTNNGAIKTSNLHALGSLGTLGSFSRGSIYVHAGTNIETGGLTAINDKLGARINLDSAFGGITVNGDVTARGAETPSFGQTTVGMYAGGSGGITITGNLTATGHGGAGDGVLVPAADVDLYASAGGINIAGAVNVTGHPVAYDMFDRSGVAGYVQFHAYAGGGDDLNIGGPINIKGVGHATADFYGANVTTGDITVHADPESFTGTSTSAVFGEEQTIRDTVKAGGIADVRIATGLAPGGGSIQVGNVSATGPDARVDMNGAQTYRTGAITVKATGNDAAYSYSTSYGGVTTGSGSGSRQGGFADLLIGNYSSSGSAATTIKVGGAIKVAAPGRASVALFGDTVETRGINATATGGTFARKGAIPLRECSQSCSVSGGWPFGSGSGGGPRIDEGTFIGGAAHVFIGGNPGGSGSSYGPAAAASVNVNGGVDIAAPGNAQLAVHGNHVTVSGDIRVAGGHARQDGTFSDNYVDSLGNTVTETGTVLTSYGRGGVDIAGSGDIRLGNIAISGPAAGGHIEGANVRVGAISMTASGGVLDVNETRTVNGVTESFRFKGPDLVAGLGLYADNTLELAGDLAIKGVGAGGALLRGSAIKTRNIAIDIVDGAYTVLAPDTFGNAPKTFTAGNAILGIEGATAQVNGSIAMNGSRGAHFGGNVTASGDFSITGGTITRQIPDTVQFLNAIDSEDDDATIALPSTFNVHAANVSLGVTNGNLDLGAAQFTTNGTMALHASGAVNFANRTQSARSILITAGTDVNLSNSVLKAMENIEVIAGGSLNASAATMNAGTIRLEAGTDLGVSNISLDANSIALVAGGNISNSSPPGTITAGALAILAGGNVNLGNTTLDIGSGSIASVPGDTRFLDLLAMEGIVTPAGGPNLVVRARNVRLGRGSIAGDYVYLETNSLAVTGTFNTDNPDLLLQVAPLGKGAIVSLEQSSASSGDATYFYNGALDAFSAGTIALGSTNHTGNVGIAQNSGTVDIGNTNLFVLTQGTVLGLDRVRSTGVVKDLATLISGGFDVPQTDEIDTSQDAVMSLNGQYKLDDGKDDEEGEEEGEDTDTDTGIAEDDDSLIRQDTADEEMMCQ